MPQNPDSPNLDPVSLPTGFVPDNPELPPGFVPDSVVLDFSKAQPLDQTSASDAAVTLDFSKAQPLKPPGTLPGNFFDKAEAPESLPGDFFSKPAEPLFMPVDPARLGQALIYSHMLGLDPAFAYQKHDEIKKQLQSVAGDFWSETGEAIETGAEETPLGMLLRGKSPEPFESHDLLENFIHDTTSMLADPVFLGTAIAGSFLGGPEVGIPLAFALDEGLRKGLMDHYQKGNVQSFGELTDRASSILWAGAKGAITGEVAMLAGGLPVPGALAGNALARFGVHALYQSAALTAAGALMDWRVPRLEDFTRTAAVVTGMGLLSLPSEITRANAQRALMDVYAKDGTPPTQAVERLQAQPTVEPEMAPGLKPAIRITLPDGTKGRILGDEGETHPDLAERMGQRPVTMDELEKDPALADKVLAQPEIHLQQIIDRAAEIKREQGLEVPDQSKLQSGRGFLTPDGKFLNRSQAEKWVEQNEPEVHAMWQDITKEGMVKEGAILKAPEFHSDDYFEARDRVLNRMIVQGDPAVQQATEEELRRIAAHREALNQIKAGSSAKGFGEALRAFFVGSRNEKIALARQVAGHLRDTLPDSADREALGIFRDYKGDEATLQAYRAAIDAGDEHALRTIQVDELLRFAKERGEEGEAVRGELKRLVDELPEIPMDKLKALLAVIDRALAPSKELIAADGMMTRYYRQSLEEGRRLEFLDSSVPPERYFTHLLMQAAEEEEEAKPLRGGAAFTTRTPHAAERYYPTTLNALVSGRVEARTLNAADAIEIYGERHGSAYAGKLFLNELRNSELGKYGTDSRHPVGWVELAPGRKLFRIPIPAKEAGGMPQGERSLYVPKPIADSMKPILQPSTAMQWPGFRQLRHTQAFVKAWEVGFSVFHMKSLGITYLNNTKLMELGKGLMADNDSPAREAQERHAASFGLETSMTSHPFEAWRALEPKALPTRSEMLRSAPGIKQLDEIAGKFTHLTFDVIQRKFKVTDFSLKEAAWIADHPGASDAEYAGAMRGIAKEINASYGGLNWEIMGWSKDMLQLARAFFLAPDWTFSNVANFKYAITDWKGTEGTASRWFLFRSFAYGIGLTQATSILLSGKLSQDPTSVYMGKDKQGKDLYSNIYFAGAPKDATTLVRQVMEKDAIAGLVGFTANKMGPLVGSVARIYANRDWTGKPIVKPNQDAVEKNLRELGFFAQTNLPIPFALSDLSRMMFDPDRDWDYRDVLTELAGTYVQHKAPEGAAKGGARFTIRGASRSRKALAQ